MKKNVIWAFVGNFFNALSQWLMLVVLTKTASVKDVGTFGLALAVSTPIIMLTNLQLRSVYVTDADGQFQYGHYLALRLVSVVFALLIVIVISLMSGYDLRTFTFIVVWCLAQCVISIKDSYMGINQRFERMDLVSLSRTLQSIFSLIFFSFALKLTKSLFVGAMAVIIVRIIVLYYFDILAAKKILTLNGYNGSDYLKPSFTLGPVAQLLFMTVPLGVVMALTSMSNNLPRYFLEHCWGKEQLGYFTAIASFAVGGNLIVAAVAQTVAPRLAKYFKYNIQAYGKLLIKMTLLGVGVGSLGIAAAWYIGPWLLKTFFCFEYSQYNNVFLWMMISALPYYVSSFLNNGLMVARKLKIQVSINFASFLVVVVCSWILIPKFAQIGAAWALTVGSAVLMIENIGLNWLYFKRRYREATSA